MITHPLQPKNSALIPVRHDGVIDYYAQLLLRMEAKHAPVLLKKWQGMMRTERDASVIGKMLAANQASTKHSEGLRK